jgi:hypothetical protein
VEGATLELNAAGRLSIDGLTDGRLRGQNVLHLDPARTAGTPSAAERLRDTIAQAPMWDSDVLEHLAQLTEQGRAWVNSLLEYLLTIGVMCMRVADLVTAIGAEVQARLAARQGVPVSELAYEGGTDLSNLTRMVRPDETVVVTDLVERLRRVVPERIALVRQERVRTRLTAVFEEWLRILVEVGFDAGQLNQREMADRLSIPDATLSDYLVRLRGILVEIL